MTTYGKPPVSVAKHDLHLPEFMHYLYLPVVMPDQRGLRLPENLKCLRGLIWLAMINTAPSSGFYVYVSARRGWATPGNALNRPGWHTDGFGTDDLNYIWWSGAGTRFAIQDFGDISDDHTESTEQFEARVEDDRVVTPPERTLYRLDRHVVHAIPEITKSGPRSFVKISISRTKYNLEGNSHNHLFAYDWAMHGREVVRNDPHKIQADHA